MQKKKMQLLVIADRNCDLLLLLHQRMIMDVKFYLRLINKRKKCQFILKSRLGPPFRNMVNIFYWERQNSVS